MRPQLCCASVKSLIPFGCFEAFCFLALQRLRPQIQLIWGLGSHRQPRVDHDVIFHITQGPPRKSSPEPEEDAWPILRRQLHGEVVP